MGLFDDLKGAVFQAGEQTAQGVLSQAIEGQVPGGLGGLLSNLQSNGLGDAVSAWTSGGGAAVTPDMIKAALGDEHIANIASSMGLSTDQIAQALSDHLPALAAQTQTDG